MIGQREGAGEREREGERESKRGRGEWGEWTARRKGPSRGPRRSHAPARLPESKGSGGEAWGGQGPRAATAAHPCAAWQAMAGPGDPLMAPAESAKQAPPVVRQDLFWGGASSRYSGPPQRGGEAARSAAPRPGGGRGRGEARRLSAPSHGRCREGGRGRGARRRDGRADAAPLHRLPGALGGDPLPDPALLRAERRDLSRELMWVPWGRSNESLGNPARRGEATGAAVLDQMQKRRKLSSFRFCWDCDPAI